MYLVFAKYQNFFRFYTDVIAQRLHRVLVHASTKAVFGFFFIKKSIDAIFIPNSLSLTHHLLHKITELSLLN